MSPLDNAMAALDGPTGNAKALLHEIAKHLEVLARNGESAAIDLRAVPLSPGDRDELKDTLGVGVVEARIDALGRSEVREAKFPGVWWVTHYNEADEIVAELIEICAVPLILQAPVEDISQGAIELADALKGLSP